MNWGLQDWKRKIDWSWLDDEDHPDSLVTEKEWFEVIIQIFTLILLLMLVMKIAPDIDKISW